MLFHWINIAQAAAETSQEISKESFIEILGIDWKLFIAQLINFGLVLFVLWRWVYRPLVKILNERTKKIEKSLKEAEEIENRLAETKKKQEEILANSRKEAMTILEKAENEAKVNRNNMLKEAEEKINKQIDLGHKKILEEKDKIIKEIKLEVADLIELSLEKIIPDNLDSKMDKKMIKKILEKHES